MSPRRWMPWIAVAMVAAIVVVAIAWKHHHAASDPYAAYCDVVAEQRGLISNATSQGATTGLIAALPSFEKLQARSPSDVADDWAVVTGAVQHLVDVLREAGVDPSTYDRAHPPAGLDRTDRGRIDAAATRLGSDQTRSALASVDQEARDVCHSPLLL